MVENCWQWEWQGWKSKAMLWWTLLSWQKGVLICLVSRFFQTKNWHSLMNMSKLMDTMGQTEIRAVLGNPEYMVTAWKWSIFKRTQHQHGWRTALSFTILSYSLWLWHPVWWRLYGHMTPTTLEHACKSYLGSSSLSSHSTRSFWFYEIIGQNLETFVKDHQAYPEYPRLATAF